MKNAILILKTCSIKYGKNFALLGSFIFGSNAIAATYYVDAKSGNDSWSGTSTSVSSPNGPWQSIARVNAVKFQPGDQVLFGCGQRWSDSLKPTTNGTATAKVYFGSYPKACTDKPKISGFKSIPNQNWQPYQGNIWKTTFPQNLIINSNLSTSASNWSRWPSDASQLFNATCPLSVAGCMNFIASPTTNSSVAVSNTFPLVGGQKYVVTVSFYAKSEMSGYIVVRENGNTYRSLGLSQKIIGNDKWQNLSFEFTATHTLGNARLDIDVPKGKQIYVRQVRLQQSGVQSKPNMLVFNGDPVTIAHHPNAGHDAANPESVYFLTTSPSPSFTDGQGRKVSSQINTPDLKIPSGGSINSGTKLKLRYLEYEVNDYTVSGVNTSSISFTPNTLYPASKAGAGFYFYDAFWMLDSAGEWFFDDETQSLYLWTPTGEHPGNKVSISALGTAINLTSRSNLTVENIEIDGASIGVNAASSTGITLQSMNIHNIDKNAIFARNSVSPTIANNRFNRISASGDSGVDAYYSSDAIIEKNEITEAGVFVKSGKRISLPMTKGFGILGGSNSNISNNSLTDVGGTGVLGFNDADIDSNTIERACSNINDCAAIYLPTDALRSKIRNNLVLDVIGDMVGNPGPFRLANGIYLDDGVSGISVTGNTVKGAASSIHLHNSGKNIISDNIFYGAENRLIWQQEDTISNGGITGNVINNNQMFPSSGIVAIHNQSLSGDSSRFATYNKNIYSAIHSPYIAREYDPLGLSDAYTLEEWQVAESKAGTPRNNDLDSEIPAPLTSFAPGLVGNNFLANTDFSAGINGWSSWNEIAPKSSHNLEGCLPVSSNCLRVTSGASSTLVSSPNFILTKGKIYRVTFDLKATIENANMFSVVQFAGPTNYKDLMKTPFRLSSSVEWKRHSFVFEATDTATSATENNQGARIIVHGLPAGQELWIANLEIAPFDPGVLGPTKSDLLVNKSDVIANLDCPTRKSDASQCSHYFTFPEATAAVWPLAVPPRSGRIVFTQNVTLLDTDGDGIADSQDECGSTVKGQSVNGKGCSLTD